MQSIPSMPRLYYVNQVATRLWLRRYCVNTVATASLWRRHSVLARLRPRYVNFEHVQCFSTFSASMETTSRPYRFLLRSHGVVQVLTASCRFFVDVVGTWCDGAKRAGALVQWWKMPKIPSSSPALAYKFQRNKTFLPRSLVKMQYCRASVACSTSDRQGSSFELCVWRAVSSHHPQ